MQASREELVPTFVYVVKMCSSFTSCISLVLYMKKPVLLYLNVPYKALRIDKCNIHFDSSKMDITFIAGGARSFIISNAQI